ncbi:MAG: hypothetical protein CL764_06970 [Chloroflexi bacterium]|nr:hypothetical protein [Chloroflexota bacterium]|tara:strand:+ start:21791 stop:22018 length:228 start_codon:yes stop_codon:yes gene_type:complete
MNLKTLNNYLSNKRKLLLITLNIVLVIFVALELTIWNNVSDKMTEEELAQARRDAIDSAAKERAKKVKPGMSQTY